MTNHQLPEPVGREDTYLAAILDEIRGIRADLKKYGIPPDVRPGMEVKNTVELHEPAQVAKAIEAASQEFGAALSEEAPTEPKKNLVQRIIGR